MTKFYVKVFGTVPQELEIEARDREEAEELALLEVVENHLTFKATVVPEEPAATAGLVG
jgi:hypothetical protein